MSPSLARFISALRERVDFLTLASGNPTDLPTTIKLQIPCRRTAKTLVNIIKGPGSKRLAGTVIREYPDRDLSVVAIPLSAAYHWLQAFDLRNKRRDSFCSCAGKGYFKVGRQAICDEIYSDILEYCPFCDKGQLWKAVQDQWAQHTMQSSRPSVHTCACGTHNTSATCARCQRRNDLAISDIKHTPGMFRGRDEEYRRRYGSG